MRVAFVCPRYPPYIGGVETHVSELASRLSERGCSVEVFTQADGPSVVEQVGQLTVRRFRAPAGKTHRAVAAELCRAVATARDGFDIVHGHDYHALPALGAAFARPRRFVFTPHYHGRGHSIASRFRNLVYRPFGTAVFSRSEKVICVSEAEATLVGRHFPRTCGRIVVIPNGLSLARVPQPRPEAETRLLVTVGRLERYKNVEAVVKALAELPSSFQLAVIGEGPTHRDLEELVVRRGLQHRVELLGSRSDLEVRETLSAAGAVVTMSRHEAFGLTLLEALAGGLPVVASAIPAHRELQGRYGVSRISLVPVDASPRALAGALQAAVSGGRQAPPDNLPSWEEVAAATLRLYLELTR